MTANEWHAIKRQAKGREKIYFSALFITYQSKPGNLHEKACRQISEFHHCTRSCIEHSESQRPCLKIEGFLVKEYRSKSNRT